jgi:parvulin-like peptidyl-prolyl isomerase
MGIVSFLSVLSLFSLVSTSEPKPVSEKIEARVGSEIITTTDIDLMIERIRAATPAGEKIDFHQKALQDKINLVLVRQYLARMNAQIPDRDVDQRVNSIRSSNGIQTNEQFRELLEKQGMTFERLRDQIREQMEQMQFVNLIRRQSLHTIEDKELVSFYKTHADQYKATLEIELQECVIPNDSSEAAAEKIAEGYIKNPKAFLECMKKYSTQEPGTPLTSLGKFKRGMLRDDIEAKVFSMKEGQVTTVKNPGGIQLLKVVKIKNLGPQKFDDVKDQIREQLENEIVQKEIQKTLAELKSSTFIKI